MTVIKLYTRRNAYLVLFLIAAAFFGSSLLAQTGEQPSLGPYLIGPEDVLSISVWREPDLSVLVPVRPDGRISVPLVGEVDVVGRTPQQIQEAIESEMSQYLTAKPTVSVIVSEINSKRIFILGQVGAPGALAMRSPLTALQAIALAGGLTEFADKNGIIIIRGSVDGTETRIRFDYKNAISAKGSGTDMLLQSGDIMIVP